MTLRIVATVLVTMVALGAVAAWRPAPAVTVALIAAVAAGIASYVVARADGPRGVPAHVAEAFSVGLVIGGLLGLVATRRRRPGEWPMRRDALWLLAATPFAASAFLLAIQSACPLYVTKGSGLCFYDVDVLGGWASEVTLLFVVDAVIVAGILWLAPGPRRRATPARAPLEG
ncbi:MAG: hypothetical protein ACM3OO_09385 [Planctomycetaceae bacterium]